MEVLTQIVTWLALFASIASLSLAAYTIWLARMTEHETRQNFQKADDRMREHYDRMKEVLAAIETKSATIEQTVQLSQTHLLNTITNLVNETVIPKKPDMGEQFAMLFMQHMMKDPKGAGEMMKTIQPLIDQAQKGK